ncbi:Aste57867_15642 [Aphanomyces stellatus]|uniref:Aste57867_15642 protein n=1 Tax=Aphanomyces stellatus TaxID=120398 RepID=A0A485L5G9_9STRA|nr:hypothetical protein As57867_015586 [Aphanomyces stellatus]VFT92438.1 Aste57867_15642 [Aphanomyces stellatus]
MLEALYLALLAAAVAVVAVIALSAWRRIPGTVELIYNGSSAIHCNVAATAKTLTSAYDPPWWALNAHLQLVMFALVPQVRIDYSREILSLPDGGIVSLDWLGAALPSDAPIVLVLHTLAGCSKDLRYFCDAAVRAGYRAVVFNKRGHGKTPLTTPKMQAFGCIEDMKLVIQHIQDKYPAVPLVGAGYSAGAGLLSAYLGELGADSALQAGVLVSPGYDHYIVHANARDASHFHELGGVHPVYNFLMAKSLKMLLAPHRQALGSHIDFSGAMLSTCMADFDKAVYLKLHKIESLPEYWEKFGPLRAVDNIAVPTLFISSKDDPVCRPDLIDVSLFDRNPHLMLAFTTYGSHCGFYQVKEGRLDSWAPHAALDYLDSILDRRRTPAA